MLYQLGNAKRMARSCQNLSYGYTSDSTRLLQCANFPRTHISRNAAPLVFRLGTIFPIALTRRFNRVFMDIRPLKMRVPIARSLTTSKSVAFPSVVSSTFQTIAAISAPRTYTLGYAPTFKVRRGRFAVSAPCVLSFTECVFQFSKINWRHRVSALLRLARRPCYSFTFDERNTYGEVCKQSALRPRQDAFRPMFMRV